MRYHTMIGSQVTVSPLAADDVSLMSGQLKFGPKLVKNANPYGMVAAGAQLSHASGSSEDGELIFKLPMHNPDPGEAQEPKHRSILGTV